MPEKIDPGEERAEHSGACRIRHPGDRRCVLRKLRHALSCILRDVAHPDPRRHRSLLYICTDLGACPPRAGYERVARGRLGRARHNILELPRGRRVVFRRHDHRADGDRRRFHRQYLRGCDDALVRLGSDILARLAGDRGEFHPAALPDHISDGPDGPHLCGYECKIERERAGKCSNIGKGECGR